MKQKSFDIKNYKGNYVMHCKDQTELDSFVECLKKNRWCPSGSYGIGTGFYFYGNHVYYFNCDKGIATWSTIQEAKDNGYVILEWSDFIQSHTKNDCTVNSINSCKDKIIKKIKIFKNNSEICKTINGASYVIGTWAKDEAEEFINREDIKVLDIKYSNGFDGDAILIVYEEVK